MSVPYEGTLDRLGEDENQPPEQKGSWTNGQDTQVSVHVMSWVLRESDATLGDRLVLLVLADHAKGDGTSAWPSLETIAHEARLSVRQVRRCLRNLEQSGDILETGTSRKGTHVYSFPLYGGDNMSALGGDKGGTNRAEGEDRMSPEPSLKQPSLTSMENGKPKNEIWDALSVIFGEPTTRPAQRERGQIVRDLTEAGATPDDIFARSKRWAKHFDHATLTAHALVKHWDTLPLTPRRVPR